MTLVAGRLAAVPRDARAFASRPLASIPILSRERVRQHDVVGAERTA
jgi:hypothetical protein